LSKIKIAYIQPNGFFSGAAISLFYILKKLDKEKFEPIVIICSEGPLRGYYEKLGIKVYCAKYKTYTTTPTPNIFDSNYYYNLWALFSKNNIKSVLEICKPDIVHVNDKSALMPGMHAFKLGYKVVWHLRSTYYKPKSYLQYFISKQIINRNASYLISISEDEVDCFKSFSNLKIIYNSIDFDDVKIVEKNGTSFRDEFNISNDDIAVGMFGNLDSQKGAWNFIKAAGYIKNKRPDLKIKYFLIAPIPKGVYYGWRGKLGLIDTTSSYQKALELVKLNGLEQDTVFTDRRDDVLNIMLGLDIVSAVYNLNAIGRPALEAAAIGKPIIVNKGYTGNSNLVKSGITGLIVNKENHQELGEAIIYLLDNKKKMKELGVAAKEHAISFFDSDSNCRQIENVYTYLIKQNFS
jgi:glycosyltransferase involved in cell wall biosynthesis